MWCDAQQIRQALTNLLQNAVDSLKAQEDRNARDPAAAHFQGRIDVCLAAPEDGQVAVLVADNGPGLPANVDPLRLVEPYVTLKEKGTGLGLAIVKKVMEDHKGRLLIGPPEWLRRTAQKTLPDGAVFALVFPVGQATSRAVSNLSASVTPPV